MLQKLSFQLIKLERIKNYNWTNKRHENHCSIISTINCADVFLIITICCGRVLLLNSRLLCFQSFRNGFRWRYSGYWLLMKQWETNAKEFWVNAAKYHIYMCCESNLWLQSKPQNRKCRQIKQLRFDILPVTSLWCRNG